MGSDTERRYQLISSNVDMATADDFLLQRLPMIVSWQP